MIRNYVKGFTHGGVMHSDEVFATALLRLIDSKFEIIRQKDRSDAIPCDDDILVFDIGLGRFDHHQKDAKLRPTGKKFSSVGLILEEFWEDMGLSKEEYLHLDKTIIEKIDLCDNYGDFCDYAHIIDSFNTSWKVSKDLSQEQYILEQDKSFENAVLIASEIINMELKKFRENKEDNSMFYIEQLYIKAFMNIINEKYTMSSLSFLDIVKKNYMKILPNDSLDYIIDKIKRYQNCFDTNNYNAGFVRIANNYDYNNDFEYHKALKLIEFILNKDILSSMNEYTAKKYILEYYKNSKDNYIIIPIKGIPWVREVTHINETFNRKIDFVIYENDGISCGIQCVPKSFYYKNTKRIPFPKIIRGASSDNLTNYLDGLTFCHSAGFFAVTKDLHTAEELIKKVSKRA